MRANTISKPDRIGSYFICEWIPLTIVTVSGIIYNVGMVAGPYFEGKLVQKLFDIMNGKSTVASMILLVAIYIGVILFVQLMRSIKRFYVRRMANNMNRNMRHAIYHNLVFQKTTERQQEDTGSLMTKVISDVDACVEGMRKFTTEVFDTGVVLVAYLVMLFVYDWRLALLSCIFPPIAYIVAEKLKKLIYNYNKQYKKCAEKLNNTTYDRISGAMLYRIYGRETQINQDYNKTLREYEKAAVKANIWENAMQPIYLIISSISVIFIIFYGSKNVIGTGWTVWNIAAFTTFLSCFTKMATKSSKAAKLFNAVQKASVSWKRIRPFMNDSIDQTTDNIIDSKAESVIDSKAVHKQENKEKQFKLSLNHVSFAYPDGNEILKDVSFTANEGMIIGVTGPVGSGKSTLGKVFLNEYPYQGSIKINDAELSELSDLQRNSYVTYMGHKPELISGTIKENICFGDEIDCRQWLNMVSMGQEIDDMPLGIETQVGNGGTRLSGGQQARIALARTLCHGKQLLVLDDPLSAVDKQTEAQIMEQLKQVAKDRIIILITHRLTYFDQLSKVIWINNGKVDVADHKNLYQSNETYRQLFTMQMGGRDYDEE